MMTSHDHDRQPLPPDGGTPAPGGAPQPDAPGGGPAAEAFLRDLEQLKQAGRQGSGGPGAPDSASAVRAPGQDGPGPEAAEVAGYPLTRTELLALARHWARQELDGALFWFATGQDSRADRYRSAYAGHRLGIIAEALGPEAVRDVVAEVGEGARRGMSDKDWRAFTDGTEEELQGVWEQTTEALAYLERKCRDEEARARAFAFLAEHPGRVYLDADGDLWCWGRPSPGEGGPPAGRLWLQVITPGGASTSIPGYELDCPPGWSPPYGLLR